jgi:hypothetical protein
MISRTQAGLLALSLLACAPAHADGPLLVDHLVAYDDSGLWSRHYQLGLSYGSAATVLLGSALTDSDTRLGHTFDRSMDAMVLTVVTTSAMKLAFSRARPDQGGDPNDFFAGSGHQSFPSGEVAQLSAVVTPFILEYHDDHPWVYALALLPAYDGVARVKNQQHWQSDVLAGAAVGVALGVYAHRRTSPLFFKLLPHGGGMFAYQKSF